MNGLSTKRRGTPEDHYFSPDPKTPHDIKNVRLEAQGVSLDLLTDASLFSRSRIDPGTRLLIKSMRFPKEGYVLDLGCGYGPIALAIAKLRPDLHVYGSDVNQRAVEMARQNAQKNGIANATFLAGSGVEPLPEIALAAVYTNPPYRAGKAVVYGLVDEAAKRLAAGGHLTCVGRTKQGIKSLKAHLEEVFDEVVELAKEGGYRVLEAIKYGSD